MTTGTKIAFGICAVLVLAGLVGAVVFLVRRRWALAFLSFFVALEAFTLPPAMDRGDVDRTALNTFGLCVVLGLAISLYTAQERKQP